MTTPPRALRRFLKAQDGAAAVEMSLVGVVFLGAVFNAVEIGRYGLALLQVNTAAQAGVAAAYKACDTQHLPATQNCADLATAVGAALHSTSLGDKIALQGSIQEGWYCVNATTKKLQYMDNASSKPADCTAAQNAGAAPGLYLSVQASYAYKVLMPGTVAATFAPTIARTAMTRLL